MNRLVSSTYRESKDDTWIVQPVVQSQPYTGFTIAKLSLLSEVSPIPLFLCVMLDLGGVRGGGFEPVNVL